MDTPNPTLKCCSRKENCVHPDGPWLPATTEHFRKGGKGKLNLKSACKACMSKPRKVLIKDNLKLCAHCQQWKHLSRFSISHQSTSGYQSWCKDCIQIYMKSGNGEESQRRYNNSDKCRERARRHYRDNPEQHKAKSRRYRNRHPEKVRQRYKQRAKNNPEYFRIQSSNRRGRLRSLPATFTQRDWRRALEYFNYTCPICNRQFSDLFSNRSPNADHWIPLSASDCPGTIPINIVPLCGGIDGCNQSKNGNRPEEWLVKRFGKRQAKEILTKIEKYFNWLNSL